MPQPAAKSNSGRFRFRKHKSPEEVSQQTTFSHVKRYALLEAVSVANPRNSYFLISRLDAQNINLGHEARCTRGVRCNLETRGSLALDKSFPHWSCRFPSQTEKRLSIEHASLVQTEQLCSHRASATGEHAEEFRLFIAYLRVHIGYTMTHDCTIADEYTLGAQLRAGY